MRRYVHPAKFSDLFLPVFAELLRGTANVLDPMAGTGKLARIKECGYAGRVVCNELEREWANGYVGARQHAGAIRDGERVDARVDEWHFGDAARMDWAADASFDAICTSPTYGNRLADGYAAPRGDIRYTYRHALGRALHAENTGAMQWGERYRRKHEEIYLECRRVLKPNGLLIVNVSDHIRGGKRMHVADWHRDVLLGLGFRLEEDRLMRTHRIRRGANYAVRVEGERILVMRRDGTNT